jgi:hypothetical protein
LAQSDAAGIDVNDPANQDVVQFTINLAFETSSGGGGGSGGGAGGGFDFCGYWNGNQLVGSIPWFDAPAACIFPNAEGYYSAGGFNFYPSATESSGSIVFLVIPGQATMLKEFFDVSFMITNLSAPGFDLTGGDATLDVPAGMSLAPTSVPQFLTQAVADIPGGSSQTVQWIIRGDTEGSYNLSATYNGFLQPFQELVTSTLTPPQLRATPITSVSAWRMWRTYPSTTRG